MIIGLLREHLAYHAWATARLLAACNQLSPEARERDFKTADKSVSGTMIHIFRSDRAWFGRIKNVAAAQYAAPEDNWDSIQTAWPELHQKWLQWAGELSEADATRVLVYKDLKGVERHNQVQQTVLHLVNHGTHHRGQVAGFLRAMGQTPPPLDFIAYVRDMQQQRS